MRVEEEEGRSLLKSQVSTARTRGNPREDSTRFFFFAIQIRSNSYSNYPFVERKERTKSLLLRCSFRPSYTAIMYYICDEIVSIISRPG